MLSRRRFITGCLGCAGLVASWPARTQALLTDDGLYKQPWFLESFLELAEDLESAAEKGKRLAIMWELKGCPYLQANTSGQFRAA